MAEDALFPRNQRNLESRFAADMKIAREVAPLIENLIGDGSSVIDPTVNIWKISAAREIRNRVEKDPIDGTSMTQWEKLDIQLDGASDEVVLLAAELVFLREQPLLNARPQTRLNHVKSVLKHLHRDVEIPEGMRSAMNRKSGVAGLKQGRAFNGDMWRHISWMAAFVEEFRAKEEEQRRVIASDAARLQQFMLGLPTVDRSDIRNIMQFFMAPESFEPISSQGLKDKIVNGFRDIIGGRSGNDPQDIDRDLYAIRTALAQDYEGEFGFWSDNIFAQWSDEPPAEPQRRNYWIFAPGENARKWEEFRVESIMALGWDQLGDFGSYTERDAIRAKLQEEDATRSFRNDTLAVWEFQHEMSVGDIVYARRGMSEIVGRGIVESEPRFEPQRGEYRNVRSVNWEFSGEWETPFRMAQKTLTNITTKRSKIDELDAVLAVEQDDQYSHTTSVAAYAEEDFLREVFFTPHQFNRLQSVLKRKKNVILSGPPGVGKTFVARRAAFGLMGEKDPSRIEQVQFHQSYSYEDFMMGFRPNAQGGFELINGPFYNFCEKAREDPDREYFFIIDEINRGNVSKIFGELLMLIEADKRGNELRLIYSDEFFSVPDNVYLIGTMNTADRSLAVMDYALRRRFGFFNISPAFDSDGFIKWKSEQDSQALNELVDTLRALNAEITEDPRLGPGFMVGHSYVLHGASGEDTEEDWLYSVVEDDLIPLVEEYWFDSPSCVDEWAKVLRSAVK